MCHDPFGGATSQSAPKPKWVFHTEHGADIIIQSKKSRLTLEASAVFRPLTERHRVISERP
jgi:hypothetical protein